MIILYLGDGIKSYRENYLRYLPEKVVCPVCTGDCHWHGQYQRKVRENYEIHIITIRRVLCVTCRKTHALLPDFLRPRSRYSQKVRETAQPQDPRRTKRRLCLLAGGKLQPQRTQLFGGNTGGPFRRRHQAAQVQQRRRLREAFLWEDDRKVDATGCIKYRNKLYDVGPDLAGKTVEIRFDPFAPETVEIWVNGRKDRDARELVKNKDRFAPETPEPAKTDRSRYLEILTERAKARRKKRLGAISFRGLEEDGDV